VTLGSAGKGFSVTGWKVGWAFGPEELIAAMLRIHQNLPFCHGTPLQEALAVLFEGIGERGEFSEYLQEFRAQFSAKRAFLCEFLERSGLPVVWPQGSYFALADFSGIDPTAYLRADPRLDPPDYQFCRWLTTKLGVTAIPPSAFYAPPSGLDTEHSGADLQQYARFCFAKADDTLSEAERRLRSLSSYLSH
jgi:kynurenine---oxoglutarate transaminase / cysteine-S-conjugate beta-lyase / glutamine---phenylpyruvate transaminase